MTRRRERKEYAPRVVESSVTQEKFEQYLAAREKALREEREQAEQQDD